MNIKYNAKVKLKRWIKNAGLWNCLYRIYCVRWLCRHAICSIASRCRRRGHLSRRFLPLKEYENVHEGERCFIVCTGPSLTLEDVERLSNEYTFSMNSIVKFFPKTDWRPTYYVIEDAKAYVELKEIIESYNMKIFVSDLLIDQIQIGPEVDKIVFSLDVINHVYDESSDSEEKFRFSNNAYATVYMGYTVTYSIIQLAVYMGFKEIYLVGCDCNYHGRKRNFIDYGEQNIRDAAKTENGMMMSYLAAKRHASKYGIKIYNATRGGNLEVFERVDFDELMREKANV